MTQSIILKNKHLRRQHFATFIKNTQIKQSNLNNCQFYQSTSLKFDENYLMHNINFISTLQYQNQKQQKNTQQTIKQNLTSLQPLKDIQKLQDICILKDNEEFNEYIRQNYIEYLNQPSIKNKNKNLDQKQIDLIRFTNFYNSMVEIKNQGNQQFKQKQYKKALVTYNLGIHKIQILNLATKNKYMKKKSDFETLLVSLISNKALCELNLSFYQEAFNSTESILQVDPNNIKAIYRQSLAKKHIADQISVSQENIQYNKRDFSQNKKQILFYETALKSMKFIKIVEPGNKNVVNDIEYIQNQLKSVQKKFENQQIDENQKNQEILINQTKLIGIINDWSDFYTNTVQVNNILNDNSIENINTIITNDSKESQINLQNKNENQNNLQMNNNSQQQQNEEEKNQIQSQKSKKNKKNKKQGKKAIDLENPECNTQIQSEMQDYEIASKDGNTAIENRMKKQELEAQQEDQDENQEEEVNNNSLTKKKNIKRKLSLNYCDRVSFRGFQHQLINYDTSLYQYKIEHSNTKYKNAFRHSYKIGKHCKTSSNFSKKNKSNKQSIQTVAKPKQPYLEPIAADSLENIYTLVLDLDKTLIYSDRVSVTSTTDTYSTTVRPYLFTFLDILKPMYELVIFTAAEQEYADKIIKYIDPDQKYFPENKRLYQQHVKFQTKTDPSTEEKYKEQFKDLRTIGRNIQTTLIVDDIEQNFALQIDNGILIPPWTGDKSDQCLLHLIPVLQHFAKNKMDVQQSSQIKLFHPKIFDGSYEEY